MEIANSYFRSILALIRHTRSSYPRVSEDTHGEITVPNFLAFHGLFR